MSILKIKFKDIKKIDIVNIEGGLTYSNIIKKYNPDVLVNLALYDVNSGMNIVKLKDKDKESGYLFSDYGLNIYNDNKITFEALNHEADDYVGGAPTLLKDGLEFINWVTKLLQEI